MNKRLVAILGLSLITIFIASYFLIPNTTLIDESDVLEEDVLEELVEEPETLFKYGIPLELFEVTEGRIKRNQTFADILLPYNMSRQDIFTMDKISKQVFSVRNFVPNRKYTIFYNNEPTRKASYFVYEPNELEYVVYQLGDSLAVFKEERKMEIVERTMAGVITQSLDHSIRSEGGSPALVSAMADVFGWQIEPRMLRKGDWFKVIYEDRVVDGKSVGIGNIIGAEFNHMKNAYYAYAYDKGDGLNFFDEEGESVQKAFLRFPVEYSRISSRYNPRRFHPVLKRRTPHLGTDFAANRGTPIKAAADGIIVARGFTRGNGNYIKIKHNGTYTTGYLHMSKFGKLKKGQHVKKGQIIGYVGKTGLATGYHLCFRFWKRGRQVDFLKERENLPSENPLTPDEMIGFEAAIELVNKKLNDIPNTWADNSISASND